MKCFDVLMIGIILVRFYSVEAPGVAFFVKNRNTDNSPLVGSLAGSWPILVVTLLLASLSGVIIWFLVRILICFLSNIFFE